MKSDQIKITNAKRGYVWEDHRGRGANPRGGGVIFYVPVGDNLASVAAIVIDYGVVRATVESPKFAQRLCKNVTQAKRWIERTARAQS